MFKTIEKKLSTGVFIKQDLHGNIKILKSAHLLKYPECNYPIKITSKEFSYKFKMN